MTTFGPVTEHLREHLLDRGPAVAHVAPVLDAPRVRRQQHRAPVAAEERVDVGLAHRDDLVATRQVGRRRRRARRTLERLVALGVGRVHDLDLLDQAVDHVEPLTDVRQHPGARVRERLALVGPRPVDEHVVDDDRVVAVDHPSEVVDRAHRFPEDDAPQRLGVGAREHAVVDAAGIVAQEHGIGVVVDETVLQVGHRDGDRGVPRISAAHLRYRTDANQVRPAVIGGNQHGTA